MVRYNKLRQRLNMALALKLRQRLKIGFTIKLKRKPTSQNCATLVYRTINVVDFNKKIISCDDNIDYKFSQVLL